jgi:hypothetical protein
MNALLDLYAELKEALEKAHYACTWLLEDELYDVIEHTYHMLYGRPTECELASVKIHRGENEISITYDAGGACADDEEEAEEIRGGEEEQCLKETEEAAMLTLNEYRRLIREWAEERGISYVEELKRDGPTFTLAIRITSS